MDYGWDRDKETRYETLIEFDRSNAQALDL